jgi:hypothetical protein
MKNRENRWRGISVSGLQVLVFGLMLVALGIGIGRLAERKFGSMPGMKIGHLSPYLPPVVEPRVPVVNSEKELLAIRAFEHWMDSLSKDGAGRRTYDSIIRQRPGLMDSARQAEAFYNHLLK